MSLETGLEKAIFAAGRFWGLQFFFDQLSGVIVSRVGYIGGKGEHPTFEQVNSQSTGHVQAVELQYDPELVTYETLLKHFFRMHDPTDEGGQGEDRGEQYHSSIFYCNDDQKVLAEIIIDRLKSSYRRPIITRLEPATTFYEAEAEHQKHTEVTGEGMSHLPTENMQE